MTFLFLKNSPENGEIKKTGFDQLPPHVKSSILSLYGAFPSVSFLKGDESRENESPEEDIKLKACHGRGCPEKSNIWAGDGRTQGVGTDAANE